MNQDLFDEMMAENSHLIEENKMLLKQIKVFNSKLAFGKATTFLEANGDCPNCGIALKVEFRNE